MCASSSNLIGNYQYRYLIFFIVLFNGKVEKSRGAGDWCYRGRGCGPKTWPELCNNGKTQSPINISPLKSKLYNKGNKLIFNFNYNIRKKFFLVNNGHTVQVLLQKEKTSKCLLRGDGIPDSPYYLSQMHFHWGKNNRVGSEHRIAGFSFPMEMHMVHVQVKDQKSIAVLGIFFYLSLYDNPYLQPIVRNLQRVRKATDEPVLISPKFTLNVTALLPKSMRMFRYDGSLTTPPCTEGVNWTVFQEPVPVSARQLAAFRKLLDHNDKPMLKTYRPLQATFTTQRKNVYFMRLLKRDI